jgi:hypothetical protein
MNQCELQYRSTWEEMPAISLYSYLYLKLAKMLCFYYLLCFLNKIREEEGGTGSAQ